MAMKIQNTRQIPDCNMQHINMDMKCCMKQKLLRYVRNKLGKHMIAKAPAQKIMFGKVIIEPSSAEASPVNGADVVEAKKVLLKSSIFDKDCLRECSSQIENLSEVLGTNTKMSFKTLCIDAEAQTKKFTFKQSKKTVCDKGIPVSGMLKKINMGITKTGIRTKEIPVEFNQGNSESLNSEDQSDEGICAHNSAHVLHSGVICKANESLGNQRENYNTSYEIIFSGMKLSETENGFENFSSGTSTINEVRNIIELFVPKQVSGCHHHPLQIKDLNERKGKMLDCFTDGVSVLFFLS